MPFKLSLNAFFQLLKTSTKKKSQKFIIPTFRNNLEILLSLCGAGLIKGFSFNAKESVTIYLRYDSAGASVINNIIVMRSNNIKYLSSKELKSMKNTNKVM